MEDKSQSGALVRAFMAQPNTFPIFKQHMEKSAGGKTVKGFPEIQQGMMGRVEISNRVMASNCYPGI